MSEGNAGPPLIERQRLRLRHPIGPRAAKLTRWCHNGFLSLDKIIVARELARLIIRLA
jgi:hypothetical protein